MKYINLIKKTTHLQCNKNHPIKFITNKTLAAVLSTIMLFSAIPASAEEYTSGVAPTYDEAYYGVLDYYGNLTDGSIVKSYILNGSETITDYGNYKEINNLTDSTEPKYKNGKLTFEFNKKKLPDHFYFEGKNSDIYINLPWKISMSYKLNGVPIQADKLAGQKGIVEIDLNIVPNKNADEYARNNYTLEAMTVFNQSNILSLEQEGGQVQLIGNLRTVIFAAMPGAEEHFKIWVGADQFEFNGFTFMMAPATLSQLDILSDLQDKKEDIENDYNKLSNSIDETLDALANMEGSLNDSANGLDELNAARSTISSEKDTIYKDIDTGNTDLNNLANHVDPMYQNLEDIRKTLNDCNTSAQNIVNSGDSINNNLKDISESLNSIKGDLDKIKNSSDSLSKNNKDLKKLIIKTKELNSYVENISTALDNLHNISEKFQSLMNNVNAHLSPNLRNTINTINYNINAIINSSSEILKKTSSILDDLDILCKTLDDLENVNSAVGNTVDTTKKNIDSTIKVIDNTNTIISEIHDMQNIFNDYEPKAQSALKNLQNLSTDTASSMRNMSKFITDTTSLSRKSVTQLDIGSMNTLNALSDTMRKTADAVATSKNVKNSKDTIDSIIRKTWDEHTGEIDNILNMDNSLPVNSLTSTANPNPTTVQVLVRSQEITIDISKEKEAVENAIDIGHAISNVFK